MKSLALGAGLGLTLLFPTLRADTGAPLRVGHWELNSRPVFAVAADPAGRRQHFAYTDGTRIHHAHSADGGLTWSAPQFVATGSTPELAIDRGGTAHLVYEAAGTTRVEYRSFGADGWSAARDITAGVSGKPSQALAPRIAVDGAGHVHVIYWTLWKDPEWKPGSRTAYWRKPAGQSDFEPPILWSHAREGGNARYGTLAIDSAGDLHLFYASHIHLAHFIERRVRHRDGSWGRHDVWRGHLVTDWCIGAAVTADAVAHLTVQSKLNDHLHVFYANTRADPLVRTVEHDFGPENYETVTQLLAAPNGDLWFAAGHVEHREYTSEKNPHARPNLATWSHYRAATATWSERLPVSPPGAINVDARRGNHPRLVLQGGQVRIFYAEKLPGGKWRHWQRLLSPAPAEPAAAR